MTTKKPKAPKDESFAPRWGDDDLDDQGYVTVPGWILRNYHLFAHEGKQVGITPIEFAFIVHVMSFKWDVIESEAKPSLITISHRMGRHPTNIHATKRSLIKKGAMEVISGKVAGKPNIYSFAGLCRQCRAFEAQRYSENTIPTYSENATPGIANSLHNEYKASDKKKKDKRAATPSKKNGWANEDALIQEWARIRNMNAAAIGATLETPKRRACARRMLKWPIPLNAADIADAIKVSKSTDYEFTWLEDDVPKRRALRANVPTVIPETPIEIVPPPADATPATPEQIEAAKAQFAALVTSKDANDKPYNWRDSYEAALKKVGA